MATKPPTRQFCGNLWCFTPMFVATSLIFSFFWDQTARQDTNYY